MNPQAKKKLIGAIVAAVAAIAVYYGLISQKQANNINTQADQSLGTGPAQQTQQPGTQQPTTQPAPQQTGSTMPASPTAAGAATGQTGVQQQQH